MFVMDHVNHNNFLVIDVREHGPIHETVISQLAGSICREVLVDDVLVLERSHMADARLRIFGADEREADFCGNGALLTLHLLFSEWQSIGDAPDELVLQTASGVKRGAREKDGRVSINVGMVRELDTMIDDVALAYLDSIGVGFEGFRAPGEPHLVVSARPESGVINQSRPEFEAMARSIAQLVEFDGGVNVTLILGHGELGPHVRTYERGVQRMTESCGSGAVAAASTCKNADAFANMTVVSPGGEHQVWTDQNVAQWWLSAPATHLRWKEFPELAAWLRTSSLSPGSGDPLEVVRGPGEPGFPAPDVRKFLSLGASGGGPSRERHS